MDAIYKSAREGANAFSAPHDYYEVNMSATQTDSSNNPNCWAYKVPIQYYRIEKKSIDALFDEAPDKEEK